MTNSLKKNTIIYSIRQSIILLLSVVVNLFLTKKLTAQDFGILVIFNSMVAAMGFLTDGSVLAGFVQSKKEISTPDINKIVTLLFAIFVIIGVFFFVIGYFFFYKLFFQYNIIYFSFLVIISTTIQSIIYAKFQKEMYINYIAITDIVSNLLYYFFALLFVFSGFGIYGLFIAISLRTVIALILTLFFYKHLIKFDFNFFETEFLFSLKKGLINLLNFPLNYIRTLFNPVIVGSLCGISAMGIIDRSVLLAGIPANILTVAVQKIIFPVFSKSINEGIDIKPLIKKIVFYTSTLDKLFYVPLILLIKPAVFFFFGEKWNELVYPVYILSIGNMIFGGVVSTLNICIISLGLFKKNLLINIFQTLTIIPITVLLCWFWGIIGYVFSSPILWCWFYYSLFLVNKKMGKIHIHYEYLFSAVIAVVLSIFGLVIMDKIAFSNLGFAILFVVLFFYPTYFLIVFSLDRKYIRQPLMSFFKAKR